MNSQNIISFFRPLPAVALALCLATPSQALFGWGETQSASEEAIGAVLSEVSGTVQYQPKRGTPLPATSQQVIHSGDAILTGSDGRALLVFTEGTKLKIGPKSDFALTSYSARKIQVRMNLGLLEAWVKKIRTRQFSIRTPGAVAAIRGSIVRTEVKQDGSGTFDFFGGTQMDITDNSGNERTIVPGQRLEADQNTGIANSEVKNIPPTITIAPEPVTSAADANKKAALAQKAADKAKKAAEDAKQKAEDAKAKAKAAKTGADKATAKAEAEKAASEAKMAAKKAETAKIQAEVADKVAAIESSAAAAPLEPPTPPPGGPQPPPPPPPPPGTPPPLGEPGAGNEPPPPNPIQEEGASAEVSPSSP